MGIHCKPMGKLKKDFKRIDRMNEAAKKEDRKSSKKKR